ncbi:MAG: hypothetical protein JHC98_00515 [Thermoleophilaceae bacterium]|nr:hypothetical protein [Thermoleophilaceae bacterium]
MQNASRSRLELLVGVSALGFSVLYLASDIIEAAQGEFSVGQLWLTLIAELAIPFFVFGLYWIRRSEFGPIGTFSAYLYAYAYVFFTFTVAYALIDDTPDYETLSDDLAPWMLIHGAIMLVAGIGFGYSIIKSRPYPRWTGIALIAGVVLVSATQGAPVGIELVAAAARDLAFAGMGLSLLLTQPERRAAARSHSLKP